MGAGDTATIFLYGDIGDDGWGSVESGRIAREVKAAESAYKKIEVRVNSCGGEVYAGIAIFNAFRGSRADITIYIDGIAASMASVIALCGKPVKMSKYARLMLHSVSGGCWGTKSELQDVIVQLESLEQTLADMYSKKTGKTPDEIKAAYFDGKDHWLSADEALALGFIDGIYDAEPVPDGSTPEQIYQTFNNRLNKPKNSNQMNIEDLRKRPQFKDCNTDEDVLRVVGHLEQQAGQVSGLTADVARLTAELKVFQDKEAAALEASKTALLDAAVKEERINAAQRPVFQALLDKDFENGKAALNSLQPKRRIVNELADPQPDEESPWTKRQKEIKKDKK